jgi:hypothetical protein
MMGLLKVAISRQLSAFSSVFFVDFLALWAVGAAKVASDCDPDGDAHSQPRRNVAGGDAQRGADAGTENNAQNNLH